MNKLLWTLICAACLGLAGCSVLPKATVTITDVVDSAMKTWAREHVAGRTTPEIDARVREAHEHYRFAAQSALLAYETYLAGGDKAEAYKVLTSLRAAAYPVIDALWPVTPVDAARLSANLNQASKP